MGLASKIKNSSSTTQQHPQPQQHAASAPGYDYPQQQQRTGSYDDKYGASPYPQQGYMAQSLHNGAPSAPPFPEPQQYYGGAYAAPHAHPVQPHGQSHVESTPHNGVHGQVSPYAGQRPISPSYAGRGPISPPYAGQGPISPPYGGQLHVESTPYGPYAGQGPISPSYRDQVQTGPYGGQGPISPSYRDQVQTGPYGGQGPISPSYRDQVQTPSSPYGRFSEAQMQPAASIEMLAHKLQAIIQANGLQSFYDQGRFQATLRNVSYINFAEIAAEWNISIELAYDLAPLALYDIVFFCDDSGSMAFEENGERIDDLKLILSKVSGIATKFDDDGIIVRFMNSDANGDGIRNAADVASLISKVRFSGMTPLGTNFDRKVIQPFVLGQAMRTNMAKPVLAIIITDGEPSGEDHGTIRQVIQRAKDALMRTQYGGGAFAVQIAQVGKDARTQKFLESLDKDPVIGGMIDCTSYYELEEEEFARKGVSLTPELWLLKMCVGAIDPEYDSKDD